MNPAAATTSSESAPVLATREAIIDYTNRLWGDKSGREWRHPMAHMIQEVLDVELDKTCERKRDRDGRELDLNNSPCGYKVLGFLMYCHGKGPTPYYGSSLHTLPVITNLV